MLANDSVASGGADSHAVSGPSHGTLTLNGDGSFTYAPTAGYTVPELFTYYGERSGGTEVLATPR